MGRYSVNICQHDPSKMVEWYDKIEVDKSILVITAEECSLKENYIRFLLHLNEDFDDDLLQDSLEILGFE